MATETIGRNIAFNIYNADGTRFNNLVLKKATYDSVVMSLGDKITGDVYYKDNSLQVTMREYVEYNNVRFVLVNPPTIVKEGIVSDNSELKGTTKYSFTFYHPMYVLNNIPFTDVAVSSDQEKYLSQNKTFSWIGTCHDFINKLNKNLQGTEWVVVASGDADSETKMSELSDVLSFDKQYIGDALKTVYETWGVPFVIDSLKQGEYFDDKSNDYYSQDKRFVVVIGVPSNEIINQESSGERVVTTDTTGNSIPPHYSTPITIQPYRKIILESLDADAYPLILDAHTGGVIGTTNRTFTEAREIYIGANRVGARIRYFYDDEHSNIFVFKYGQGVGLKNNSRTPRNNKIVTRISGYGSEENIPYGYPQIVWNGSDDDQRLKYPLYKGIVGGKYVTLIKHPFTRTTLMPSIYTESVNKKVNPNASGYNPDIELVDYYDAVFSSAYPYVNEINLESPSHETHQFEEIKPELDSSRSLSIVSVVPINDTDLEPASGWVDDIDDDGKYKQSYFKITIQQLDFDVYACASITQEMKINMRGGACIGCTFDVSVDWDDYKKNFYDQDGNFAPDGEQRNLEKYPKSNTSSITLIVKKDIDTFGTLMPNIYQIPKSGDTFVILGISLPQTYITNAERRLDEAMKKYMLENNIYYYDYPLKFDEYFLANNTNILSQIKTNSIIRFNFANELMMLYVKQITIKYGDKPLPEYAITLTDNIEVVLNQITKVEGEVSNLSSLVLAMKRGQYGGQSSTGGGSTTGDYISKTNDDTANGVIGFLKGLWVGVRAWFWDKDGNINANTITLADKVDSLRVLTNSVKSHNYNGDGILDTGFMLTSDDGNGKSKLVVDNAYFRGRVVMESVEIRKTYHTGGNEIKSPAAQTNVRVDYFMGIDEYGNPTGQASGYTYMKVPWLLRGIRFIGLAKKKDGTKGWSVWSRYKRIYVGISEADMANVKVFRCYAKSDDGTMQTRGDWMVDDQAFCQTLNLVSDKTTSGSGFSGRLSNKRYWRRVLGTGTARLEDGKLYDYVDLSADDCENGSNYPEAGDDMVCLGNRVDPERQSAIVFEVVGNSPSIKEYANINGYSLEGKRLTMISPQSGDEFYARHFTVVTGSMVTPVPVDRGAWDENVVRQRQGYYYYDRVSFTDAKTGKGGYWICLYNPDRTKYYYRNDVTICTPEQYEAMSAAEKETYRTLTRITKTQYDELTDSQKYFYKHQNGTEYTIDEFNALPDAERKKCTKKERYVEYEDFTIEQPSLQSTKWRLHVSNGSSYKGATEYYALGNSETVAPAGYNRMVDGKRVPDPTVWKKETRPVYDTSTDEGRAKMYLWNMEMTIDSFGEEFWTDPVCVGNESKGITGYDEYYGISAYATKKADGSPTDTTITWVAKNASIAPTEAKPYLWNHSVTTYSDGTTFETWRIISVHGKPGSSYGGFQEYYKLSEYSDEAHKPAFDVNDPLKAANGWSTTIPTYNGGAARYLWNAEVSSSTAYSMTAGSGYTGQTTKQSFVVCIGDHAKGISSVAETYGVSTSAESNGNVPKVMPSSFGTFATAFAALNATYRFIWNKTVTTYTDGSSETHYHVCFTKNIDISDFKELFIRHNNGGTLPTTIYNPSTDADKAPSYYTAKGWATAHPAYNNDGNVYLWNMEVTSLDDGTYSTTPPHCIGNFANGIKDIEDWYVLSTDGINNPDSTAGAQGKIGNWVKGTMPTITPDTFLWDKEVVKFTDGNLQDSVNYHVIAMYAADGKDAPLGVLSDTQVSVPCDKDGKVLSAFSEEIVCDLVLNGVANIVPDTLTFEGDTSNYVTKKSGKNDTLVVSVAANATLTEETIKVTIGGYNAAKTAERYTGLVYFHIKRWKSGDGFKQEFYGAVASTVTPPTVATWNVAPYKNNWYDTPHTAISETLQCLYAALWAIDANGNKKGTQPLAVWLSSHYGEDGADGKSIISANVWYALTQSETSKPSDTSFTLDNFPTTLNAGYYVWEATKVTYSEGDPSFTGKMCLGKTSDFLSGIEVYAISTSNINPPAENTTNWKTTYDKTKGYYLWTATRVQYTNGDYAYLNKKCVGYWGEDGPKGETGPKGENGADGKDGITVELSPNSMLFYENSGGGTINLVNNAATIIVKRGGTALNANDTSNGYLITNRSLAYSKDSEHSSTQHCNATFAQSVVTITGINQRQYSDIYGTHNVFYEQGYVDASFTLRTYKNSELESNRNVTLRLSFFVNTLGSFRVNIIGDAETAVANKEWFEYNPETGQYDKKTTLGNYIRSSSQNTATLEKTVGDSNGGLVKSVSEISQTAEQISMSIEQDTVGCYNLLEKTDFIRDDMSAWFVRQGHIWANAYTLDGVVHNAYGVEGEAYTNVQEKDILVQYLTGKLMPSTWYTFSFYCKTTKNQSKTKMRTFIYKGGYGVTDIIEEGSVVYVDGNEYTYNSSGGSYDTIGKDGGHTWTINPDSPYQTWQRHTITFKTIADLEQSCIIFRMLPDSGYTDPQEFGYPTCFICMPRVEYGKTLHDYSYDYKGYKRTGIDIKGGKITLDAETTVCTGNFYVPQVISENSDMRVKVYAGTVLVESKKMVSQGTTQVLSRSKGVFGINAAGEVVLQFYNSAGEIILNIGGTPNTQTIGEWILKQMKSITYHPNTAYTRNELTVNAPNAGFNPSTKHYELKLGVLMNSSTSINYFLPPNGSGTGVQTSEIRTIERDGHTFDFTNSSLVYTDSGIQALPYLNGYYVERNDGMFALEIDESGGGVEVYSEYIHQYIDGIEVNTYKVTFTG